MAALTMQWTSSEFFNFSYKWQVTALQTTCVVSLPKWVSTTNACSIAGCVRSFSATSSPRAAAAAAARVSADSAVDSAIGAARDARLEVEDEAPKGMLFSDLKGRVSDDILKAVTVRPFAFTHMTSVQEAVLPLLPGLAEPHQAEAEDGERKNKNVRDLLVRAKTGTGKTLAFLVPAMQARLNAIEAHGKQAVIDAGLKHDKQLEARAKRVYAQSRVGTLIISPTRELATQIANEAIRLSQHLDGFEVRLFTGGTSKNAQLREWRRGRLDIVVSTPGRIRDFINSEPDVTDGLKHTQTVRPTFHNFQYTHLRHHRSSLMRQILCLTWGSETTLTLF